MQLDDVGRVDDDGLAGLGGVPQHLVDLDAGPGVDAAGRLVREQDGRFGEERAREEDLLLVAARQRGDGRLGARRPDGEPANFALDDRRLRAAPDEAESGDAAECEERRVLTHAERKGEPLHVPVARQMDDARTHRAARIAERDLSAPQLHASARGQQARERAEELALAVALDARQSDDLTCAKLEIDVVEARTTQGRDVEQRRWSTTGRRLVRERLADRPADDQPQNLFLGSVGGRHGSAGLAVSQNGDAVGDALHFRQPMRDVDDCRSVPRDRADAVEEAFALGPREELGRLVEHEDLRLERERLGDLEQLPVRNTELADPR